MQDFFNRCVLAAVSIVENGGEISRAEEAVVRACKSRGAKEVNVFIIPSALFACAVFGEERLTAFKRIYKTKLNLAGLEYSSALARSLCNGKSSGEISSPYPAPLRLFSAAAATGAFCLFFGGNVYEAAFSALIGAVVTFLPFERLPLNLFSVTLLQSLFCGALAFVPLLFGVQCSPDSIMTGTIMLFIPGMSVGIAIKDMLSGDIIAGILELTEAFAAALAIVLGFAGALVAFKAAGYG